MNILQLFAFSNDCFNSLTVKKVCSFCNVRCIDNKYATKISQSVKLQIKQENWYLQT